MLLTSVTFAQDPVFSRFTSMPTMANPAFLGLTDGGSVSIMYRNQWAGIDANFETIAIGGSIFYPGINSAFGLSAVSDDAADGVYKNFKIDASYGYRLRFRKGYYMMMALELGYGRVDLNDDDFIYGDQLDPVLGAGIPLPTEEFRLTDPSKSYIDIGAGALIHNEKYFAGISFKHLNNPNDDFLVLEDDPTQSLDGLPMRWSLFGGYTIPLYKVRRDVILSTQPQIFYTRQRGFEQFTIQSITQYKRLDLGLGYRHSGGNGDAAILSFGVKFDALKIHYAYDWTLSELGIETGGSHEIGMRLQLSYFTGFQPEDDHYRCIDMFK